ncbi:MFS transporter [Apilactobacillus ozensis]|nr:MFS transporter [Apilactobacillus ozensis]
MITIIYNSALGIWSGTIYLFMRHIGYTYAQINMFLMAFWIVTFIAELPSGWLSDYFGHINIFLLSCVIRSLGLLILFLTANNVFNLIMVAILTGIGDSLFSGTLDAWFVNKAKRIDKHFKLENAFTITSTCSTILSLLTGFIGAQYLANLNLGYPILAGSILLILCIPFAINEAEGLQRFKLNNVNRLKHFRLTNPLKFEKLKQNLKINRDFYFLSLAGLPLSLIVSGPFNQWQLLFQSNHQPIHTGWILIGVNMCGVIGSGLSGIIMKHFNKLATLILLSVIMTFTTLLSVSINSTWLAVMFFLLHVLATSLDEVFRYTMLHNVIIGDNRNTLISFNNTINAGATLIALSLNGWLSDTYSIKFAWGALAIIGEILTLVGYFWIFIYTKNKSNKVNKN